MSGSVMAGCLCGEIRFSVADLPLMQVLCHCTDCQIISGAAYYCAYLVPLDTVSLQQGEPARYDVVADSGRRNSRRFCSSWVPGSGRNLIQVSQVSMAAA